jgi:hypothetical protein
MAPDELYNFVYQRRRDQTDGLEVIHVSGRSLNLDFAEIPAGRLDLLSVLSRPLLIVEGLPVAHSKGHDELY